MKPVALSMISTGAMLKFLFLLFAVTGFNARPLQHKDLQIQNGGLVIGHSGPDKHQGQDSKHEPEWEVVLAPVNTVNQKVAPIDEKRQGTEPSRRFLVDLNTGMLKEYISEMDRRAEVHKPVLNPEFRQGTENSHVTLVDIRSGQQLPQLSEMQRRASPLSGFRQGTEYSFATLMELRKAQMMKSKETPEVQKQELTHNAVLPELRRQGTEPSRHILVNPYTGLVKEHVSEMERRVAGYYSPVSNPEFRQGTENSHVTLVDIRSGQQLPQLSEMQRRASPYEFRQGTEYNMANLMTLRKAQMISEDKIPHTVQDVETNEVFPEFKRGIEYSQFQRRQMMGQLHFRALESNEVDISSPMEFRHGMEYIHANIVDRRFMEPSHVKQNLP